MQSDVNTVLEYKPRPWQQIIHDDIHQYITLIAHRGAGKSWLAAAKILMGGMTVRGKYAYISPSQKQSVNNIWQRLIDMLVNVPQVTINKSEYTIYLPNNSEIMLKGVSDPDSLRGLHLAGAVVDETADISIETWGKILYGITRTQKAWILFIGTVKTGKNLLNHVRDFGYSEKMPKWSTWDIKAEESGTIPEEELEEIKLILSKEQFDQEFDNKEAKLT